MTQDQIDQALDAAASAAAREIRSHGLNLDAAGFEILIDRIADCVAEDEANDLGG